MNPFDSPCGSGYILIRPRRHSGEATDRTDGASRSVDTRRSYWSGRRVRHGPLHRRAQYQGGADLSGDQRDPKEALSPRQRAGPHRRDRCSRARRHVGRDWDLHRELRAVQEPQPDRHLYEEVPNPDPGREPNRDDLDRGRCLRNHHEPHDQRRFFGRLGRGGGIVNFEGTVTVANSTFSENESSGIFDYQGTVTVANSTFSDNAESGIVGHFSSLTVANSTFSGNAAGISSDRSGVTITNSTFSGNGGGGISAYASAVTVANSTFSGNSAGFGGGISNNGSFEDFPGTVTVTNSTFSGNTADGGGGIENSAGTVTVTNSTLSGNAATSAGGGIDNSGSLTVANTIVAANGGGNCGGVITDGGYDLEFTPSPGTNTCGFADHALSADPMLGPLRDNGGPTQTMAPEVGSPAVDAIPPGTNGCGTTIIEDQRAVARPQGPGCDIGAYEVKP
jgi:hypothetical protein